MIRLIIADDHAIVREGIKRIIDDSIDMKLVGEADNGNAVISLVRDVVVDVVLLDISMPGPGFLEVMRRLCIHKTPFSILVLSIHPEKQYATRSLQAGASGYLTKNHSPKELLNAIRHIYRGGKYISPSLAEHLADNLCTNGEEKPLYEKLSDREYQILCMLGSGMKSTDIAKVLSLSPKTINTYRTRIFEKMDFKNYAQLILYVVKHGIVD